MTPNIMRLMLVTLLLGCALFYWPGLFLFSKVVHLPAWTELLPDPFFAAWGIATICMLPAALSIRRAKEVIKNMGFALIIGPIPGVMIASVARSWDLANVTFQYLWVLIFCLAPPALLLIALKVVWLRTAASRAG